MTSEGSFVQPAIPRFDGHYDHWSILMENFLCSKEYWNLVETRVTASVEGVDSSDAHKKVIDDQKLKDLKCKNYLFQAIDRLILETILKKDTAKDIWDSLKQKYQGTARVKRAQLQALRKEFEVLHMKVGESNNDYFGRTLVIANKMRIHKEHMEDAVIIENILRSMVPKYDYVWRNKRCKSHLGLNKEDEVEVAWECPKKAWDSKTNYAETKDEMLLMAHVDFKKAGTEHIWFLNSGCSNHMSGKRDIFVDLDSSFKESIKMGNDSSLIVQGKGTVRVEVKGIVHVIMGVFFVLELKNNLLSIGQLQEKGFTVLIQRDKCKIFHPENGLIIETKMTPNRMFIMVAHCSPPSEKKCFSSLTTDQATLWHR
ncbi:uncharacterized protein [Malus domestica]|uniref:uncharacterized protein n=1 Tax=Malus domestica TaxID=3750 RepID=UPI0004989E6A|nr:uncharacterized protein LOC103403346 [Malus domestica]